MNSTLELVTYLYHFGYEWYLVSQSTNDKASTSTTKLRLAKVKLYTSAIILFTLVFIFFTDIKLPAPIVHVDKVILFNYNDSK